jgi:hypothetical protein
MADKYEDVLMKAIGFNEEALELNRQGKLSVPQLDAVKWHRDLNGCGLVIVILGFIVVFRLFGGVISSFTGCMVGLIAGGLCISTLYSVFNEWYKTNQDVNKSRIEIIEGYMTIDVKQEGNKTVYCVVSIEGIEFIVKKKVFLAFKNGEPYRIYYTPNTKRILSVEWLR